MDAIGTGPQTIGHSLLDSPAGLCAWLGEILDQVTLHWLTGTATWAGPP